MRALYEQYFHIGENERISDKKMLVRIVATVLVVIICLLGMSVTSIAFYTMSIESTATVAASTFYTNVKAVKTGDVEIKAESGSNKYSGLYTVPANTECTFTLTLPENVDTLADTGYCKITVGNDLQKCYYTKQFGKGLKEENQTVDRTTITFKVKTNADSTDIRIQSCWGTCSYKPIIEDSYVIDPLYTPTH